MMKVLRTLVLVWLSSVVKGRLHPGGHLEVTKLKMSLIYVRTVKTFRLLVISFLSMGVCLILLVTGIVLFHVSLFVYTPWSMETKMLIGFLSSGIYLAVTCTLIAKVLDADKWLEIFHVHQINEDDSIVKEKNAMHD